MPRYHRLAVAMPAKETLQKQLPSPRMSLRESERLQWIGNTVAQQLDMPPEALVFDYSSADANSYSVTAARRKETERLQRQMTTAGLHLCAITPDACALQNFLPWMAQDKPGICWHDGEQWLWATRDAWGCASQPDSELLVCTTVQSLANETFNPWFPLTQLQPPLPENGDPFAIALALALGGY
ncbi:pilus assembly protein [Enterobacteriaceae bacterium 89]|nr:pilus assembly protein [Enterobacteriaceae bacterium 89]